MAQLHQVLKSEIARLAAKEVRAATEPLRASIIKLKREVRELRQQLNQQEKTKAVEYRASVVEQAVAEAPSDSKPRRFSAPRLKAWRTKTGLSAPDLANILGVSAQSIYNWENGAVRPGDDTIGALARLKELGKRELRAALEKVAA